MRVLFIFNDAYMNPRMGIMYLASSLKAQGHETRIASASKLGMEGLGKLVVEWEPHIVGYTSMTGEHVRLLEVSRALKQKHTHWAVFGGPHATFCADELIEDSGCDAACVGEGDLAFPEFIRRLEAGESWWETPNFVVRRDGEVFRNALLPRVEDLDGLPMPDHDLMYEADPYLAREGTKIFYSSRDCPCSCSYCAQSAYNRIYEHQGFIMRRRSPKLFVDEIVYIKERYPLTCVMINDDSFLLNPQEWFDVFCPDYKARVGLPFSCCVRASLVTDERIRQLRDAGMTVAAMGVECGNETIANDVLKRNMTKEQIRQAAEIIKRHGIFLVTLNLCGLPVADSYNVDMETVMFNVELAPNWAWSSLLYPYPGTAIRPYSQDLGMLPKEHVPVLLTNKRTSVFRFSSPMEKRKIENLHKLFDIFVRYPWLRRHADFLCALPLGSLYRLVWYLQYGYMWKVKAFPFQSPLKEIWKYMAIFFNLLRQS